MNYVILLIIHKILVWNLFYSLWNSGTCTCHSRKKILRKLNALFMVDSICATNHCVAFLKNGWCSVHYLNWNIFFVHNVNVLWTLLMCPPPQKKLVRNRGVSWRGGPLRKGGSKLFCQLVFRKACFHYYWNTFFLFLSGNYSCLL